MKAPGNLFAAGALALGMAAGCDDSVNSQGQNGEGSNYTDGLDPGVTEYGGNPNCRAWFGSPAKDGVVVSGETAWSSHDNGRGQVCSLDLGNPSLREMVRYNFPGYNASYPLYPGASLVEVPAGIDAPLGPDKCVVEFGYFVEEALGSESFQPLCAVPGRADYTPGPGFASPEHPYGPDDPNGNFQCLIETRFDVNDCLRQFVADLPEDEPLPPALEPFSGEDQPNDVCREDNPNREEECI